MWTTKYIRGKDGQVVIIIHQFDNEVAIWTDLYDMTTRRYHGGVCVTEFPLDPQVANYMQMLDNIGKEVSNKRTI